MTNSRRIQDILARVQPMRSTPTGSDFIELIEAFIEVWKDDLIVAPIAETAKVQGRILGAKEILTHVRRDTISKPSYKDGAYIGE